MDQILLDEPHLCFPDPTDVEMTPDGRFALVGDTDGRDVARPQPGAAQRLRGDTDLR